MATEMISLKMDTKLLKEVDSVVRTENYHNRTEFIRNALREKVDTVKLRKAMMEIAHLKGASKKKTTDEDLERIRDQVFNEFDRKIR